MSILVLPVERTFHVADEGHLNVGQFSIGKRHLWDFK